MLIEFNNIHLIYFRLNFASKKNSKSRAEDLENVRTALKQRKNKPVIPTSNIVESNLEVNSVQKINSKLSISTKVVNNNILLNNAAPTLNNPDQNTKTSIIINKQKKSSYQSTLVNEYSPAPDKNKEISNKKHKLDVVLEENPDLPTYSFSNRRNTVEDIDSEATESMLGIFSNGESDRKIIGSKESKVEGMVSTVAQNNIPLKKEKSGRISSVAAPLTSYTENKEPLSFGTAQLKSNENDNPETSKELKDSASILNTTTPLENFKIITKQSSNFVKETSLSSFVGLSTSLASATTNVIKSCVEVPNKIDYNNITPQTLYNAFMEFYKDVDPPRATAENCKKNTEKYIKDIPKLIEILSKKYTSDQNNKFKAR